MSVFNTNDREFMQIIKVYINKNCSEDIKSILSQSEETSHYFVTVKVSQLLQDGIFQILHAILMAPSKTLTLLDKSLYSVEKDIHDSVPEKLGSLKENVHIRLVDFPFGPELKRSVLPKASDVNKFQIITGTVIRTTTVKMLEYRKDFQCPKCKYVFQMEADIKQFFKLDKPTSCPNTTGCSSTKFRSLGDDKDPIWYRDYQEVKIQEQLQHLGIGTLPRTIWIILYDDLVDICQPGNDVEVSGIVTQRWKPLVTDCKSDIELILQAHNVKVLNNKISANINTNMVDQYHSFWNEHKNCPLEGRNKIVASVCPQVYGLYLVKLAMALILTGGTQRVDNSGSNVRGESHLLLVGDPGTAKSQFLKYAAKVSPRSVLTTGIGTTSAGLTVTAVKDGCEWQLEAGALVLADSGVCCIDEFNSIAERDRACIHEAMEQQTISVAKAGMVCKLGTKCSVIAATNPKESRYDPTQSISVNTAIASPLLSRFDIVLVLEDQRNKDWDTLVSSYILQGKDYLSPKTNNHWPLDKMQSYFCSTKSINPEISDDAKQVLLKYYQCLRNSELQNQARTTIRMFDSLIRLVQAHARLMYCETVHVRDAIVVITIMEASLQGAALIQSTSTLHTTFPDDADLEYLTQAEIILKKLKLGNIFEREKKFFHNVKNSISNYKIHGFDLRTPLPTGEINKPQTSTPLSQNETIIEAPEMPSIIENTTPKIISRLQNVNTTENIIQSILDFEEFEETSSHLQPRTKKLQPSTSHMNEKRDNTNNSKSIKNTTTKTHVETPNKVAVKSTQELTNIFQAFAYKPKPSSRKSYDETNGTSPSISLNNKISAQPSTSKCISPPRKLQKSNVRNKFNDILELTPERREPFTTIKETPENVGKNTPSSKKCLSLTTKSKLQMFSFEEKEESPEHQIKKSGPIKRSLFNNKQTANDDEIDLEEFTTCIDNLLAFQSKKIKL